MKDVMQKMSLGTALSAQSKSCFSHVEEDYIKQGNILRSYLYHVPKTISEKTDIIFVLHGSTMTSKQMLEMTGFEFNKIADSLKNIIVIYPQGYENYWNDCRKSATYKANKLDLDEMSFFKEIVLKVKKKHHIKHSSIFVTGYSNGGQMVYKLAKENPEFFKGFAAISANMPVASNNDCHSKKKEVSMLVANGTSDPINPFNGGEVIVDDGEKRGEAMSTFNTVEYWKDLMRGDEVIETKETLPHISTEDTTTVIIHNYSSKQSEKNVKLVMIKNGGHIIPNPGFSYWPKELGNVNKDINLPKFIVDFFIGKTKQRIL